MDPEILEMSLATGLDFGSLPGLPKPVASEGRSKGDAPLVGVLFGLDERGGPLVCGDDIPGRRPVPARSVVPLSSADVGREIVLMFERGDPDRPLVMGVLRSPRPEPVRTEIDGEKLVLTADREIVLRCGEASITLTRSGKIILRGTYLLSRSSGTNCIKGASVQIN
jgi:hypothetical protein